MVRRHRRAIKGPYVPPGFSLLSDRIKSREEDVALRDKLATGKLKSFYLAENGHLIPIQDGEWISQKAEKMLRIGMWEASISNKVVGKASKLRTIFVKKMEEDVGHISLPQRTTMSEEERSAIKHERGEGSLPESTVGRGSTTPAAELYKQNVGEYWSPFVKLMIDGSRHFAVEESDSSTKKNQYERWFAEQVVGDRPISLNMAKMMATFIRPPAAMIGGAKRGKKHAADTDKTKG